ncbi:hypothetical protein BRADI_5g02785v3 [Brachypodium distachyon]|uniref:Uncharacterized protein n=1 Tax=Brachypodium distachyon TaxID=15368 RepID=A0A0Q3GLV7_BRADI|nr:hypothetical protein BRADI_5g02785v3 [Brachypodium distachyon]
MNTMLNVSSPQCEQSKGSNITYRCLCKELQKAVEELGFEVCQGKHLNSDLLFRLLTWIPTIVRNRFSFLGSKYNY